MTLFTSQSFLSAKLCGLHSPSQHPKPLRGWCHPPSTNASWGIASTLHAPVYAAKSPEREDISED
eukprot:5962203-Prorocentrum_lima.AAC.1